MVSTVEICLAYDPVLIQGEFTDESSGGKGGKLKAATSVKVKISSI